MENAVAVVHRKYLPKKFKVVAKHKTCKA